MEQEKTLQLLVKKVENIEKALQRIESELDEVVYPAEDKFRPEFVERVEKAAKSGKYKEYSSVKELREKLEADV